MTGRGLGNCNGNETTGFTKDASQGGGGFNRGYGRASAEGCGRANRRGFGCNRGFSNRGFVNYSDSQYSAKDEAKYLENEIAALKNEIKAMENRLTDLKNEDK